MELYIQILFLLALHIWKMDIVLVYGYHKVFLEFVWFLSQKKKKRKK